MYRGKFAFQNDWASLMVGRKFTIFALFYFVKLRVISYIWRGDLTEGLLRYLFGGLIFGGALTWDGGGGLIFGIVRYVQTDLTTPNNVGICRPTMLRPFAQGFTFNSISIPLAGYSLEAISVS